MQSQETSVTGEPVLSRRGAAGKAFIVWLASGSLGLAVVAYILFYMMGC